MLQNNNNEGLQAEEVEQDPTFYDSIKDVMNGAEHNDLICKRIPFCIIEKFIVSNIFFRS